MNRLKDQQSKLTRNKNVIATYFIINHQLSISSLYKWSQKFQWNNELSQMWSQIQCISKRFFLDVVVLTINILTLNSLKQM